MAKIDTREQAEAVARWCGWETEARTKPSFVDPSKWIEAPPVWVHRELGIRQSLPDYAASLDAMREVEDEIARRWLMPRYERSLLELWANDSSNNSNINEYLIRLTAAQRLEAAARVIEEANHA